MGNCILYMCFRLIRDILRTRCIYYRCLGHQAAKIAELAIIPVLNAGQGHGIIGYCKNACTKYRLRDGQLHFVHVFCLIRDIL